MANSEEGSSVETTSLGKMSVSSDDISLDFMSIRDEPNNVRIEIHLSIPGLPTIVITLLTEEVTDCNEESSYSSCSEQWTCPPEAEPPVDIATVPVTKKSLWQRIKCLFCCCVPSKKCTRQT